MSREETVRDVADSQSLNVAQNTSIPGNEETKGDDGNVQKDPYEPEIGADLTERGFKAMDESDFDTAIDCFRRALDMRVDHYGEFALECLTAYCRYTFALIFEDQQNAAPSATMSKEVDCQHHSDVDGTAKNDNYGLITTSPILCAANKDFGSKDLLEYRNWEEAVEDDLDPVSAWKILSVVREIVEKESDDTTDKAEILTREIIEKELGDSLEKADILFTLGEAALKRKDIDTSLNDYAKALSILQHMVEPDGRRVAELNFRICLCLEAASKFEEAITYCKKAISVCQARMQLLKDKVKNLSGSIATLAATDLSEKAYESPNSSSAEVSIMYEEAEIVILTGLATEFEKKLQDLQQLVSNPTSISSEVSDMASTEVIYGEKLASRIGTANSSGHFNSPTTSHTNDMSSATHLGKVGKGVKRLSTSPESSRTKKSPLDSSSMTGKGSGS